MPRPPFSAPLLLLSTLSARAIEIMVSPDGPVKTLLEARNAARKALVGNHDKVAIRFPAS